MKLLKLILLSLLFGLCFNWLFSDSIDELKSQYESFISNHQYAEAIKLCQDAIKGLTPDTPAEGKKSLELWLDEARRQATIFSKLIKDISSSKKKEIISADGIHILINKANEIEFEGQTQDTDKKPYQGKWTEIPAINIYKLFDIKRLKGEDKYNLAVWCSRHELTQEAEYILQVCPKEPSQQLINELLARLRNIPLPDGGFVISNNYWITKQEALQREALLKKLGDYKGVIDKAGADKENLPWEKARDKETDHFIVKTNLSVDALNDICILLECAYFAYQDFFGCEQPQGEKLLVMVTRNKEEFQKTHSALLGNNPPPGCGGIFIPTSYSPNKSGKNHLMSCYNFSSRLDLASRLLHEGTHYATDLVERKCSALHPPMWIAEGWATYNEVSRLGGKKIVTNVINPERLSVIKDALNKQTYIKLKDFINKNMVEYNSNNTICYAEGWSLIYFLINGQDGKYKTGLRVYMEAWKKCKIIITGIDVQDKDAHIKIFEECMGVQIDQLEKEWKEYVLSLKEK